MGRERSASRGLDFSFVERLGSKLQRCELLKGPEGLKGRNLFCLDFNSSLSRSSSEHRSCAMRCAQSKRADAAGLARRTSLLCMVSSKAKAFFAVSSGTLRASNSSSSVRKVGDFSTARRFPHRAAGSPPSITANFERKGQGLRSMGSVDVEVQLHARPSSEFQTGTKL